MRRAIVTGCLTGFAIVLSWALHAAGQEPYWAYGFPAPSAEAGAPPAARGGGAPNGAPNGARAGGGNAGAASPLRRAQGSTREFTTQQINDGFAPADWFPEDHPVMPEVVAHGKNPQARACALCHMPNGKGRPENAPVAGQPYDYIIQQLTDFRNDLRGTAEPRKTNTHDMAVIAKALTEDEMKEVARYFSSMPWTPWIRVVEAETIPRMRIAGNIFFSLEDGTTEPLGARVIETPENTTEAQLRNPRVGFIAYVPPGSIAKGEALVTTGGNGRTLPCTVCHGPDLKGVGPLPGIAGRSPSYLARQLYDIQQGTRHGTMSALMKPVVEKLTEEDMINIVAYVSSRPVASAAR